MSKPLLLDLFCGVGGCTRGYQLAGFEVIGVDQVAQPLYCGDDFHRTDALRFLRNPALLEAIDAIHASPPCKRYTPLRHVTESRFPTLFDPHPDLLGPVLESLAELEIPWVVENVPGAPMPADSITLCGSMFGLRVRRHRLFASNVELPQPPCDHASQGEVVGVYGNGGADSGRAARGGGGGVKVAGKEAAEALGIDWTEHQPGLSQAIPPAYTEWIGRRLMAHLEAEAAA